MIKPRKKKRETSSIITICFSLVAKSERELFIPLSICLESESKTSSCFVLLSPLVHSGIITFWLHRNLSVTSAPVRHTQTRTDFSEWDEITQRSCCHHNEPQTQTESPLEHSGGTKGWKWDPRKNTPLFPFIWGTRGVPHWKPLLIRPNFWPSAVFAPSHFTLPRSMSLIWNDVMDFPATHLEDFFSFFLSINQQGFPTSNR